MSLQISISTISLIVRVEDRHSVGGSEFDFDVHMFTPL
jgi:hypothetical protein